MCSSDPIATGCQSFQAMSRRRWLQRSSGAAIGISAGGWLTQVAETLAQDANPRHSQPKGLLMIWLQGGPSQLETFDPHAGSLIGGDAKAIATSVKGLKIADSMPATAEAMHQACLVRSVVSKEGDHERATYHLKTGWRPEPTLVHPSIGSVVCYQSKTNLEIPRHISIMPSQWPSRGGYLGPSLDAFQIGDPANPIPNLTTRVTADRQKKRLGPLLDVMENEFQRGRMPNLDQKRTLHRKATKAAVRMMSSEQLAAFDIEQESESTQNRFGNSGFGRGLLAAIRLLSAGAACVEVELDGWDSHINNHENQYANASILDKALAATLTELEARDLLSSTVVFCGGEFGRTPRINPAAGRDHWPHGFSTLLAGGGFRRGHVHGETAAKLNDSDLNQPNKVDPSKFASDPISVPDLHATLLHALGIDHSEEQMTPVGRPLRFSDGKVVRSLLANA